MAVKQKLTYSCTNCHYVSVKWVGCCPGCSEWNSFIERQISAISSGSLAKGARVVAAKPTSLVNLSQIEDEAQERMCSGMQEWDRVLGGGVLPGSFIILTGDPGIGKSTLLMQVANRIAQRHKVIYISSEEALHQVKNRASRLGVGTTNLLFSDQPDLESIIATGLEHKPDLLILDSIQNCHLSFDSHVIPGTVAQLREVGFRLMKFAKENNVAVLVTGHVTKEGQMAGPKVLEHIVDAVFYLNAEDRWQTRVLRSVKNRFGAINEVGFFQMEEHGLAEVTNINQQLISESSSTPGSVLVCSVEGSRPLVLELQALVVSSKFGMPQRVVTGLDQKRVVLIAAILEKYLHIKFSSQDIFFKVSGGFKIKESSSDLGIALALLSSYFQKPLPGHSVAIAELSLTGQVKPANQVSACIKEVEKFGLEHVFVAKNQKVTSSCNLVTFKNVYELLQLFPEDS
ncbi:DNA repair protein RadA [Candidatus Babeliales bacterium]|nr:DNA repair protein RadA [Candidatus Babeliales bacterium]